MKKLLTSLLAASVVLFTATGCHTAHHAVHKTGHAVEHGIHKMERHI